MNASEVKKLIGQRLKGSTITAVEDFGDAFAIYFVNNEYYKSGKLEDLAVGAGPIIYIKKTGKFFETGSGQSAEEYIDAYRNCGDVYGKLSETIEIKVSNTTIDKKKAILGLKSIFGMRLVETSKLYEKIVSDDGVHVNMDTAWEAEEAKNKLIHLGFNVKRLWQKSR